MLNYKRLCMLTALVGMGAVTAFAELRPPVYSAWVEGFVDSVDTRAELEYVETNRSLYCRVKSLLRMGCRCTAVYRIVSVSSQPEWTSFKPGDRIFHEYPCDRKGSFRWLGSSLPWASLQNDGSIQMTLRSSYLKSDGDEKYRLDNDSRAFAPVISPEAS